MHSSWTSLRFLLKEKHTSFARDNALSERRKYEKK